MIRGPPRSRQSRSSAASDVYKRQEKKFKNGDQLKKQIQSDLKVAKKS